MALRRSQRYLGMRNRRMKKWILRQMEMKTQMKMWMWQTQKIQKKNQNQKLKWLTENL